MKHDQRETLAAAALDPAAAVLLQRLDTNGRLTLTSGQKHAAAQHVDEDFLDTHRNAPRPDEACLHGLIGDIARAGAETTEANPYAIALNVMVYLSAAFGRGCFMPVGNTWHHPRLFCLHAGRTGRGRKGDAASLIHRIDKAVRALNESIAPQVHRGGLSSREGLAFLIHDGYREGKEEIPPIEDKRLAVFESEFANVIAQGKRDGNTLSAALRDAWDGVSIRPATKTNRTWATDPHITLAGAITPGELRSMLSARDLTNGFANRFLIIWAERQRILPFPKATPQGTVDELARRIIEALEKAGADRFVEKDVHRMSLSDKAQRVYAQLYLHELNDQSAGEAVNALIERRAPMLLRMAMLFALCDGMVVVDVPHLEAALAWVRYWVESVKFIFASAVDEAGVAETNQTAEKIVEFLTAKGKATRTELSRDCFQGHASKDRIDMALDELLSATPPRIVVESVPRPKDNPGAPTKWYRLAANSAKSAKGEQRRGFARDSHSGETSEVGESSQTTLRRVRTFRETPNEPQTRMNASDSQVLQVSQPVAGMATLNTGEEEV